MKKNYFYSYFKKFIFTFFIIFIFQLLLIKFNFIKLYADEETYTISFKNEQNVFISTYNIKKDQTINLPNIGEKTGYSFLGFFDEEDPTQTIYSTYRYDKNKTFIPKFSPKTYSIRINLPDNREKVYEFSYDISYDFNLIDTARGYTSVIKINNSIIEPKGIWRYDTTNVVVEFTPINYTITYEYNIAKDEGEIPVNPETYTVESQLTLLNPTRKGYRFLGYKNVTNPVSSPIYNYQINKGSYGNLNLKAIYEKIKYTLTYLDITDEEKEKNPKSYIYDNGTVKIFNPSKQGYDFLGWTINDSVLEGPSLYLDTKKYFSNLTLKPRFGLINYNINYFYIDGASFVNPNPTSYNIESDSITINNPNKPDLEFIGWSTTYNDNTNLVLNKIIPTNSFGDINLYAYYKPRKYNLIYNDDNNTIKTEKYAFNEKIFKFIPDKKGFKFIDFFVDKEFNQRLASIFLYHEDKIVYAKFEVINYQLKYDLQGGILLDRQKFYNVLDTFEIRKPTKNGYNFIGWNINNNEELVKEFRLNNHTGEIILKANWEPKDATKEQKEREEKEKGSLIGKNKPPIFIFILGAVLLTVGFFGAYLIYRYLSNRKKTKNK